MEGHRFIRILPNVCYQRNHDWFCFQINYTSTEDQTEGNFCFTIYSPNEHRKSFHSFNHLSIHWYKRPRTIAMYIVYADEDTRNIKHAIKSGQRDRQRKMRKLFVKNLRINFSLSRSVCLSLSGCVCMFSTAYAWNLFSALPFTSLHLSLFN